MLEVVCESCSHEYVAEPVGGHRLLCGDSTSVTAVDRLMGGARAVLGLSDPPYNVGEDYADDDDNRSASDYEDFARGWFELLRTVTERQIVTPGWNNLASWCRYFDPAFVAPWTKTNSMTRGRVSIFACWEPIMFFGVHWPRSRANEIFDYPISAQHVDGMGSLTGLHPCPKPLAFWLDFVQHYSEREQAVVDFFAGTGTTLMACEQLGRRCFTMELDPGYCDLVVRRFEATTQRRAVLAT